MSEAETTVLPDDEWIVVFYPQTSALRLLPNMDLAKQHLSRHAWPINIFRSPLQFQQQFNHGQLEEFWLKLYERATWRPSPNSKELAQDSDATPPDLPTDKFCDELWKFMQRVGDRISGVSIHQTKSREHYEIKKDVISVLMADADGFKKSFPKQCRQIIEAIAELANPFVLEEELKQLMTTLVAYGKIKTKQNPWTLMQFYRPQLIEAGLIVRGGNNCDDDEI